MTSEIEWANKFQEWKNRSQFANAEKSVLTFSDSDKITNRDLAHNIAIFGYRSDLGNKVLLESAEKARAHRSELFTLLSKHNLAHQKQLKEAKEKHEEALKISRAQRSEIKTLKHQLDVVSDELRALRKDYLERRPLNKADVEQLVLQITEQPKFIEKQTEALLEDVSKLVITVQSEVKEVQNMLEVMRG